LNVNCSATFPHTDENADKNAGHFGDLTPFCQCHSFRFVDDNCLIFTIIIILTKTNLLSSTTLFIITFINEQKNTDKHTVMVMTLTAQLTTLTKSNACTKSEQNIHK